MKKNNPTLLTLSVLLTTALACSLPFASPDTSEETLTESPAQQALPPTDITATVQPVTHINFPKDTRTDGNIFYDVSSKETANEHRAPYGESYKLNRFERPFTQANMEYLPDIDILYFRLTSDNDWHYFFVELIGSNPNNSMQANYGIEIDIDLDGHTDYLIWTAPTFTTEWKNENLKIFADSNNDSGGKSPNQTDAPFTGNGFDTLLFDGGLGGNDPDLAWARIDPAKATVLQFAIKRSAIGEAFMWEAWADAGLRDVSKFSYNDIFTEGQAGSSVNDNKFYPIKSIFAVDNTCRAPVGFKPKGDEVQLCNFDQPIKIPDVPTKQCLPAITYVGCR